MDRKLKAFERLLQIMDELREKCPWDKKQTISSLRHLTIEETYELSEAILSEDYPEIKKELGDILLHIVFYARIASEGKHFDIADVMETLCNKLIERHPHIYGDVKAETEDQVKENWEKIKLRTGSKSALGGVPKGLPALVKAIRIQDKARGVGFDWDEASQVWDKIQEELTELKDELNNGNPTEDKIKDEVGDVLFSIVNYARFLKIDPEEALERTNRKFIKRFSHLEEQARIQGREISDMNLEEMNRYWNEAKH